MLEIESLQDYTLTSAGATPCVQLFFIITRIASLKLSLVELSIVILCETKVILGDLPSSFKRGCRDPFRDKPCMHKGSGCLLKAL